MVSSGINQDGAMRGLIIDNHRLFGVGVKHFLQAKIPAAQFDYAECYAVAADILKAEQIRLVLLEIGTARDSGMSVLRRLRSEHPQLPLLVVSDYPFDYYGPKVIRTGACGFIGKDCDPDELLQAVKCVLNGKHYISTELADRLALGLGVEHVDGAAHEALSPRELQIFRRLALGQPVTDIARELSLSVKTVDTHRRNILRKMGFERREQLARYAFERGLIPSRRLGEKSR